MPSRSLCSRRPRPKIQGSTITSCRCSKRRAGSRSMSWRSEPGKQSAMRKTATAMCCWFTRNRRRRLLLQRALASRVLT
ncbi:UNVERIFIED_CONTAM: hypothetical protein GTU68_067214 [Idotea baltica]|nr:hypothetical protein [Idotea baltica]